MLSVEINMDPKGSVMDRRQLVTIAIWNDDTGDNVHGSYIYQISHQHDSIYGERACLATRVAHPTAHELSTYSEWVWKRGRVTNVRRQRGAAALLAKVLKDAGL